MTDDGAMLKLYRSQRRNKRASNRETSTELLREHSIAFTVHNGGAHLIVAGEWDFWPGTGKYAHRGPPTMSGRGVRDLIERIMAP